MENLSVRGDYFQEPESLFGLIRTLSFDGHNTLSNLAVARE
jgi:hypothetical protein